MVAIVAHHRPQQRRNRQATDMRSQLQKPGETETPDEASASLHPMLARLAVVAVTGAGGLSSLSHQAPATESRPQLTLKAASHHHHHPIRSPNSSSLANLRCQTTQPSAVGLVCQKSLIEQQSSAASASKPHSPTNHSHQQHHHHRHQRLQQLQQPNWRSSPNGSLATAAATRSPLIPPITRSSVHQSPPISRSHRKGFPAFAQQKTPASQEATSAAGLSTSPRQITNSLVPTLTSSTSVREALVSSRRQQAAKLAANQRQSAAAASKLPASTAAPFSVTNSRVRQGALYARRQYPHPTQSGPNSDERIATGPNAGLQRNTHHHKSAPIHPTRFTIGHKSRQLIRSAESSHSLVQLNTRCAGVSSSHKFSTIGQHISKASSRFSLSSSTSSLSLAVVKRAKPSPSQVKPIKFAHRRLTVVSRPDRLSPTPIRVRQSLSNQSSGASNEARRGLKQAELPTVGRRQVGSATIVAASGSRAGQPDASSQAHANAGASAAGDASCSVNSGRAAEATETGRETRTNIASGNTAEIKRNNRETTTNNSECKHTNKLSTPSTTTTATDEIHSVARETNDHIESNHQILKDQQILLVPSAAAPESSGSRCGFVSSPIATHQLAKGGLSTTTTTSRLPIIDSNKPDSTRGSKPELAAREASIDSRLSFGAHHSIGLEKSANKNNIMMISSNNNRRQSLIATNNGFDEETINSTSVILKQKSIDSQPPTSRADLLNLNNNSQLQEKSSASINNDKSPLGLHRHNQSNIVNSPNITAPTKQAGTSKFHQVPSTSDVAQSPNSLERIDGDDENQPPAKCEHAEGVINCLDNCDQKDRAAKGSSAEREVVADELNNCCDTRSEAGSMDSRKTMDYQEEEDDDVKASAALDTESRTRADQRFSSSSISMQRSLDSLESNFESVEDQMVLGSPLVTPPPSELDVEVDEENMIERGSQPSYIDQVKPIMPETIVAGKIALKLSSDIKMRPVDIPIRMEPISDYYDLEARPFARGKFAQVKRCVSKISQKCFAAKCIKKRRRSTDIRHEILLEIEALKLSYHTNCIVKLYEVFETATEMILLLEMANGGELQRVLDDEEQIAEKLVKQMVRQILDGLILLHDSNIAHLDIKPQNLLLTETFPNGDIKLCDFGISRRITKDCEIREICGTPDYVAPEILRYDPISLATDMWSLGVLTYVLLSGYSPFGSESKQQTFCNITQAKLDFPNDIFDKISQDAIDFMRKLIIREPSDRLTSRQARVHPWLSN